MFKEKPTRLLICIGLAFICIIAGGIVFESMIVGVMTFIGLIALIESIDLLKWIVAHTSKFVDFSIFAFGVYAKIHFGVTIALGLIYAGLLFTLLYGPYIRDSYHTKNN